MTAVTLPAILTPSLISSIISTPSLPPDTWYLIAAVTLTALNRHDEVPQVLHRALERGSNSPLPHEEQLRIARRLREALIKSVAALGIPKPMTAILTLGTRTPASILDSQSAAKSHPSGRTLDLEAPTATILARGRAYLDRVYGDSAAATIALLEDSGSPDLAATGRLLYGYIFSAGTAILSPAETSFVVLAGLIPQDAIPQLKKHLTGAVLNGASVEEVNAVRDVVVRICEAAGMVRLTDSLGHGWGWKGVVPKL